MANDRRIHPEMAALMTARNLMQPAETPAEKRANWTCYTTALALPRPAAIETSNYLVATADHAVPVRLYREAGAPGPLPVVVYLHGGGFMLGDLDSSDSIAWGLCEQARAAVVSVDYRLTPDFPYPAAFNDCYGVIEHLARAGDDLGLNGSRIVLCGDSAGGSLAAACSLALRDRGGPRVLAQALVYPTLGCQPTLPSYEENRDGPSLTRESMIYYNSKYLTRPQDWTDPYAAPISATNVSGLPPTLVHTAQYDPIRDDGREYAAKLAAAGSPVTYREARGMLHGFLRMREAGPDTRAEFATLARFLGDHLHGPG